MLKAHQACIDLEKNCLRINGREIRFLSEHELPDKAKTFEAPEDPTAPPAAHAPTLSGAGGNAPPFPGSGNTLGAAAGPSATGRPAQASRYPEESIKTLMDLGAPRELAISSLEAAEGNVDMAASLLF